MKRVSILMAMAVWALGMASCGNQPSKEFKAMEEEVSSIETKICEMTDCDELQMLKFNYKPRYFDPEQQEWEEKKAAAGLDSKLTHEEQLRLKMRQSWSAPKNEDSTAEKNAKLIRRVVLGVFIVVVVYFIFGTDYFERIVEGLMRK